MVIVETFVVPFVWVFVFPSPPALCLSPGSGPGPLPQTLAQDHNLYLLFISPITKFYLPTLDSPEPGHAHLVTPVCIYWPWPTIFVTLL